MTKVTTYTPDQVPQAIAQNSNLMLVHFGSPLASTSEFVRQEMELLAPSFAEESLTFAEVELPLQNFELIQAYSLEEVPTLILFLGDQEVERLERILLPEELKELLESAVSFYTGSVTGRED